MKQKLSHVTFSGFVKTLKIPFSSLAAAITTIITIAGGIYAFQSYHDGLPRVIVEVDSLSLKASVDLKDVYVNLVDIENKYGRVTADKINDMKKIAAHLTYYQHDSIEKLLTMVYKNIDDFQTEIPVWRADQVKYLLNGKIMWPDSTIFDIANNPKANKLFHDQFSLVKNSPANISGEAQAKLREQALKLYQPGKDNSARLEVADALRVVRTELEQLKDFGNYYIEVQFTLINESTTPNFLTAIQTVKLKHPTSKELELRMIHTEQRKLEGKGISQAKARSRSFAELGPDPTALFSFFRQPGSKYSVDIVDLEGNKWPKKELIERDEE